MDEVSRLIPLWSASKPNEYIFISDKPKWACFKCGKDFWKDPTKVEVAKKTAFGDLIPLKVWVAVSECFICNEQHRWLIDPDKPVNNDPNTPMGNLIGEHASEQGKIDSLAYEETDYNIEGFIIPPPLPDDNGFVSFDEWQKKFDESDLQAYIRWLKDQQRRRAEDDRNDAS